MPIYGILFGGDIFQFFIFDGSTKPYKFSMGVVPGTQNHVDSKFKGLPLFAFSSTSLDAFKHALILGLRPICETIFNFFLITYVATLKVIRDSCARRGPRETFGTQSLPHWDEAINLAEEALRKSQDAEAQRQDNSIAAADATAEAACKALTLRYAFISYFKFPQNSPIDSTDVVPWPNLKDPKAQPLVDVWDGNEELAKACSCCSNTSARKLVRVCSH